MTPVWALHAVGVLGAGGKVVDDWFVGAGGFLVGGGNGDVDGTLFFSGELEGVGGEVYENLRFLEKHTLRTIPVPQRCELTCRTREGSNLTQSTPILVKDGSTVKDMLTLVV